MNQPCSVAFAPRQFGLERFTRGRVVRYREHDYWGYRGGTGALGVVVADGRDAQRIPEANSGDIIRIVYENGWIENHAQSGAWGWVDDTNYVQVELRDNPYLSDAEVFAALQAGRLADAFAVARNPMALIFPDVLEQSA